MIEEQTCLILGAGASVPYGLPTGRNLKNLILAEVTEDGRQTANDYPMRNAPRVVSMSDKYHRAHEWAAFFKKIAAEAKLAPLTEKFWEKFRGSPRGVDWFLRNNPEYEEIAKLHIAAVILNCEKPSGPTGNWYEELSHQILPSSTKTFDPDMLSVVSFNYDRSFERYFTSALESDYNLSSADAEKELSKVQIEHVYGQLGTLKEVPYGAFDRAADAAKGIELTRATANEAIRERVKPLLDSATYINFIGFGFDEDNLSVLGTEPFKGKRVFATSRGLSLHDKKRAVLAVGVRFLGKYPDVDALDLLRNVDIFGPKNQKTQRPYTYRRPSFVRPARRSPWEI